MFGACFATPELSFCPSCVYSAFQINEEILQVVSFFCLLRFPLVAMRMAVQVFPDIAVQHRQGNSYSGFVDTGI